MKWEDEPSFVRRFTTAATIYNILLTFAWLVIFFECLEIHQNLWGKETKSNFKLRPISSCFV